MLRPDEVRAELTQRLAKLRDLWRELGVPDVLTASFWQQVEQDLAQDLSAMRPRHALLWTLDRVDRYRRLKELDAPDIILESEAATMFEVTHFFRTLSASRRWGDVDRVLPQLFEPDTTASALAGEWTVRYPLYGEVDDDAAEQSLDLAAPFHALLERSPALREQQAVLGTQLAPFLVGRITHLLGAPPEHHTVGFVLLAERGSLKVPLFVTDTSLELATAWASTTTPVDLAPIVTWLFADAAVADWQLVHGRVQFGVRDGRVFVDPLHADVLVPGWLASLD